MCLTQTINLGRCGFDCDFKGLNRAWLSGVQLIEALKIINYQPGYIVSSRIS
jgi:hypothetical protein